jgi:pimeloyl-ACP methyl ester carboxylesterase
MSGDLNNLAESNNKKDHDEKYMNHSSQLLNRTQTFPIEFLIDGRQQQQQQHNELKDHNSNFLLTSRTTSNNQNDCDKSAIETSEIIQIESIAKNSNEGKVLSIIATQTTKFSILNPRTWLNGLLTRKGSSSSSQTIEEIEHRMFLNLKSKPKRHNVQIRQSGTQNMLKWTLSVNTESQNTPIVLVHGFCGGIGLWIHNVDALSEQRPLYAFDLLGFGRSSRPNFSSDPIVAETQFVEAIEDWRKAMKLDQTPIILMGHSFGGFLSASYAIKYPQYVKALILVDPWGFPEAPDQTRRPDTPRPLWVSALARLSRYISPLSIFRATGQIGLSLFKTLRPDFKRKFMSLLDDPDLVYDYIYHANSLNPT